MYLVEIEFDLNHVDEMTFGNSFKYLLNLNDLSFWVINILIFLYLDFSKECYNVLILYIYF